MQLGNFIRRQKWRLRPLKRLVLPARKVRRFFVALGGRSPSIQRSARDYRGPSFRNAMEVHPAVTVARPPHPVLSGRTGSGADLSEPAWLFHLAEVDFWARYGGSVVTQDNQLLGDLSPEVWGVENHPIFSQLRLPKARQLDGRTGVAVTPEAPGNYYHWLIDLLPRVGLLKSAEERLGSFDRFLVNGSRAHYEEASLLASGIEREKIQYVNAHDRFLIKDAVIPSMDHFARVIAPWKIEMLRALRDSLPRRRAATHRLYISRQSAAVRRVLNQSEFEKLLIRSGFAIVELELTSWDDQVSMFANAEVVLAPHGAALANIVFCRPGILVGEIGTRSGYRDFYLQLAASARLNYRFIEAQPRVQSRETSIRAPENEDMIVDVAFLQEFLNAL
jgi:capsular polysaccharide biosynthesis protein